MPGPLSVVLKETRATEVSATGLKPSVKSCLRGTLSDLLTLGVGHGLREQKHFVLGITLSQQYPSRNPRHEEKPADSGSRIETY